MTDVAIQGATYQGSVVLTPGSGLESAGAAASQRACADIEAGLHAGSSPDGASGLAAGEPFYRTAPPWVGFALRPAMIAAAVSGYASPAGSAGPSGRGAAPAQPRAPGELAFLDDKSLSVEDKLFQFMALMLQKADKDLVDGMKEYEAKKSQQDGKEKSGGSGGGGDGGLLGGLGDALGGILGGGGGAMGGLTGGGGDLLGGLGDALGGLGGVLSGGAQSLLKELGGPLLAAACTAVGMPLLAPLAKKIGDEVGSAASGAGGAAASRTGTSSSDGATKASSGSSSDGSFDERLEMLKLQRMVDKVNAMFSALSNVMKAMHDTQMTAVNNIR